MERILIIADGPSLRGADLQIPPGVHVIAVNGAVEWAPVVQTFFSLDPSQRIRGYVRNKRAGVRYYLAVPDDYGMASAYDPAHRAPREQGVMFLRRITGCGVRGAAEGLSDDPGAIHTGNSAYGALGLAYHWRPRKIALLGVDGTDAGYATRAGSPAWSLSHIPALFESALPQLRGIQVINGSPQSTVECFPRVPPMEAVEWLAA